MDDLDHLRTYVRDVADFPSSGIVFRDVTPLLGDAAALQQCLTALAAISKTFNPTHILGIESRGFLFGVPVADRLGVGFVPARKPGKLPWPVHSESYGLEYGTDVLEVHVDAVKPQDRVLIVDDVLATGGTAGAACRLVERCGAQVAGIVVLVELGFLQGRSMVSPHRVSSLLTY